MESTKLHSGFEPTGGRREPAGVTQTGRTAGGGRAADGCGESADFRRFDDYGPAGVSATAGSSYVRESVRRGGRAPARESVRRRAESGDGEAMAAGVSVRRQAACRRVESGEADDPPKNRGCSECAKRNPKRNPDGVALHRKDREGKCCTIRKGNEGQCGTIPEG